jgi:hypothetical protein
MSTPQVQSARTAIAETSRILVRAPELPPQLGRYISQPPRDESTAWGRAMAGSNQGLGSVENTKDNVKAGMKRGLQNIAEFEDRFGVDSVAGASLQTNGAAA